MSPIILLIFAFLGLVTQGMPLPEYYLPTAISGYTLASFSTYIDHYSPTPNQFNMRYYYRSDYWNATKPGPIFFYCGHQAPIEVFINNTGYIDYLADFESAVVVYAEHRYFGGSMPYGNRSFTKNSYTKYLSPHQAMADYAYLISALKAKYNNAPVVVWGGNYGGMLSAWMRIKYPDIVDVAISSSAPYNHFSGLVDPVQFYQIVTTDYSQVAPECPAYIATTYEYLTTMLGMPTTFYNLSMVFNTCEAVITPYDVYQLKVWLQNAITTLAISDYPYKASLFTPLPANPVNLACGMFTDVEMEDIWAVLAAAKNVANLYYNNTGSLSCNNIKSQLPGAANFGSPNGWDYLKCTYINIPIGSNSSTMFGYIPWDQDAVNNYCLKTWGQTPILNYAQVVFGASTNVNWALRDATQMVFTNGALDPLQSGGVLKGVGEGVVGLVIPLAAHCLDLRYPNAADPPEVLSARAVIKGSIEYWLYGEIN